MLQYNNLCILKVHKRIGKNEKINVMFKRNDNFYVGI
jgi:hypothetical protein